MDALPAKPLTTLRLTLLGIVGALLLALLLALGHWQLERRSWKLDLIAQVQAHLRAAPVPAPGPAQWPALGKGDAYRRVELSGTFLHERETCTQAVTVHGAGCWVLTPLRTDRGFTVLVNRGFVPPERRDPALRAAAQVQGTVHITGLLRLSEPGGGFLRRNEPTIDRWTSRDVAAIAAARRLASPVAPYFVDAETAVADGPIAGLTVVQFRNHHLVYALTWYTLAAMVATALALLARREWRLRRARLR